MNPPPITRVYIATCCRDLHLARLCVASVRYWHPTLPITLLRDFQPGDFDTGPLERDWKVDHFQTPVRRFGLFTSKLEPLFLPRRERYLYLDADTVLLGPLADILGRMPGDFIVAPDAPRDQCFEDVYYDPEKVAAYDPTFVSPPCLSNTGQFVATSGILRREDFDPMLEWTEPRRSRLLDVFPSHDQSHLNYLFYKCQAQGRLTVTEHDLFYLSCRHDTSAATVEKLRDRHPLPRVLHWAGRKLRDRHLMERADILEFFARHDRRNLSWPRRLRDLMQAQTRSRWRDRRQAARQRLRQWRSGFPYVLGGDMAELPPDLLQNFHPVESQGSATWRWSHPEAAVRLAIKPGSYRIRLETASPLPMLQLPDTGLRFTVNDRSVPEKAVRFEAGTVTLDLEPEIFQPGRVQMLRWTMNTLIPGGRDPRALGMPVSALWVFRRSRLRK